MPKGVSSQQIREDFDSTVVTEGEELRTIRPLWKLSSRSRIRVAQAFVDRRVEVDVWPNRENDEMSYTARKCRVLTVAHNPKWGPHGTSVLVLEFELQTNKWDSAVPLTSIHEIRTVQPSTEGFGYFDKTQEDLGDQTS